MKAAQVIAGDNGGHVIVTEIEAPKNNSHEVLIKVHATGLNYGEMSYMKMHTSGAPMTPGVEFAGEIIQVGADVQGWKIGDRVMGHGRNCHAEFLVASPLALMPIPDNVSWEDAAAFPNVFITAHDALITNAQMQPSESVFITGATGGVGMATLMIADVLGAKPIIVTSRSAEKLAELKKFGATAFVHAGKDNQVEAIKAATNNKGVDIIIDMIGGFGFEEQIKSLGVKGRLVNLARLSGQNMAQLDLSLVWLNRLKIIGVTFRTRTEQERIDCIQSCARDLLPHFAAGKLRLPVSKTFSLDHIADGYDYIKNSKHLGKVVLTMN